MSAYLWQLRRHVPARGLMPSYEVQYQGTDEAHVRASAAHLPGELVPLYDPAGVAHLTRADDPDRLAVLAQVILDHRSAASGFNGLGLEVWRCTCGKRAAAPPLELASHAHAAHVAEVLARAFAGGVELAVRQDAAGPCEVCGERVLATDACPGDPSTCLGCCGCPDH